MTNQLGTLDETRTLDVRPIPCSIKHGLILRTFLNLKPEEYFILLNDHDPVPLRYQFEAEFPGAHRWEYVERGPSDFRVKISKTGGSAQAPEGEWRCPGH
jgi:uncharacterized protein (DUF2249 family)